MSTPACDATVGLSLSQGNNDPRRDSSVTLIPLIARQALCVGPRAGYPPLSMSYLLPAGGGAPTSESTGLYAAMQGLRASDSWSGEVISRRMDGGVYTSYLSMTAIRDREGTVKNSRMLLVRSVRDRFSA